MLESLKKSSAEPVVEAPIKIQFTAVPELIVTVTGTVPTPLPVLVVGPRTVFVTNDDEFAPNSVEFRGAVPPLRTVFPAGLQVEAQSPAK
jgi:hypothetical protein